MNVSKLNEWYSFFIAKIKQEMFGGCIGQKNQRRKHTNGRNTYIVPLGI